MSSLVPALAFTQALGATLGALMSIWGEIAYVRAMRDGRMSDAERAYLHSIARGLRYGMLLVLFSSLGLVLAAFATHATPQPALTSGYWTLVALALLTVAATWAISRHRVSFWLGSAAVFTGWWFLVYLTIGWFPAYSFGAATAFFVVATVVFGAMLQYVRMLSAPRAH